MANPERGYSTVPPAPSSPGGRRPLGGSFSVRKRKRERSSRWSRGDRFQSHRPVLPHYEARRCTKTCERVAGATSAVSLQWSSRLAVCQPDAGTVGLSRVREGPPSRECSAFLTHHRELGAELGCDVGTDPHVEDGCVRHPIARGGAPVSTLGFCDLELHARSVRLLRDALAGTLEEPNRP